MKKSGQSDIQTVMSILERVSSARLVPEGGMKLLGNYPTAGEADHLRPYELRIIAH